MSDQPLVSIIIPTYNRAHLIGETLDSVLAQTYDNWECIIVDDGSSDNTDEVIGEYTKKDTRFKYYHRPEEHLPGGNGARNYGFKMSEGEYVNWLDSDDLFSENKIEEQVKLINEAKPDVVTCKWGLFDGNTINIFENLKVYKNYNNCLFFYKDLFKELGYFASHSYLVKRSLVLNTHLWNEYLRINQDGVFFLTLLLNAEKIYFANKAISYYRTNRKDSTSKMSLNKVENLISSIKIIEEHLKIRFKDEFPEEFENYKWKTYLRIPRSYYGKLDKDKGFFNEQIKRQRKNRPLLKGIKVFIKKIIRYDR